MKKFLYTLLFTTLITLPSFAQDPGFGSEGDGDAQTSPNNVLPISDNIEWVLLVGVLLGAYFVYNNRKSLSKN